MEQFTYKPIYEEEGKRILEMNILPEKYCNFDCVFCPIGRSAHKPEDTVEFEPTTSALQDLKEKIRRENPDLVFINSRGEALIHNQITDIIGCIHQEGKPVRLLSNGYLLGREKFASIANLCEEMVAEIKTVRDQDFQKLQRPVSGYHLEEYVENLVSFRQQYQGKLLFEITIIKKYNDDPQSIQWLLDTAARINPDRLMIVELDGEKVRKTLGVGEERLDEVRRQFSEQGFRVVV